SEPAREKLPPTKTSPAALTARDQTSPLTPFSLAVPNPCQVVVFNRAMLVAGRPPAWEKRPPMKRFPPATCNVLTGGELSDEDVPVTPPPMLLHALPFHWAT